MGDEERILYNTMRKIDNTESAAEIVEKKSSVKKERDNSPFNKGDLWEKHRPV